MQHLFFLVNLIGQRVTRVARVLYQYRGLLRPDDGALEIEVENGRVVLLEGTADGDCLRVREGAWEDPFSDPLSEENTQFVEQHGKWVRVDCSQVDGYFDLVGKPLLEVCALANHPRCITGVRVSVEGRNLWFAVDGDESRVYWSPPMGFEEVPFTQSSS